ncbi:hypothetical protein JW877_02615, partial [bacterium]|nr:hypothetical protein [bacterium]
SYQGKVTDVDGVGITDTLDIGFSLWNSDSTGDSLWGETQSDVPIIKGLFDVQLGSVNPIGLSFETPYWLQITVDGDRLTPRMPLSASPYSFRAGIADSIAGGVTEDQYDTMIAHWDSLRGIPADIADGDDGLTSINWNTDIVDIPPGFADGVDDVGQQDTFIAHWDSLRGVPDDLGNRDTVWSKEASTADTIVIMANTKVHGELIADSIQAVGDIIIIDDHLDIYGCASFLGGLTEVLYTEGFESGDPPVGWDEVDASGTADLDYVAASQYPSGFYPTEGAVMVEFNSFVCAAGNQITLRQTTGFSTTGYTSIKVSVDMLHDTGYPFYDDLLELSCSRDGLTWIIADTLHRVDGSTGWKTETIILPESMSLRPTIYLSLKFISGYGNDVYIDNLIVTGVDFHTLELARICDGEGYFYGDVTANAFIGDGSGLTSVPGDNLGNHTATQNLDIAGFEINLNSGYLSGDGDEEGIFINSEGYVGIGTTSPTSILEVSGTAKTTNFQMTSGATNGYILKSNASGNASWTNPATVTTAPDGDWVIAGSNMYSGVSGTVGIGTTSPAPSAALDVSSTSGGFVIPRLTNEQRDAISSPTQSLMIYNLSTKCLQIWEFNSWNDIYCPPWCGVCGETEVVEVTNDSTGETWMDRNLGASRQATAFDDYLAYGALFQWGRLSDGHECINWTSSSSGTPVNGTTDTTSSTDNPGHSLFIIGEHWTGDWRDPQNNMLWQGAAGINNPCPPGYRLPTRTEWTNEWGSWSTGGHIGAFGSTLKLIAAGSRVSDNGLLYNAGDWGYYWSSTIVSNGSSVLWFTNLGYVTTETYINRAGGLCVRCIKD